MPICNESNTSIKHSSQRTKVSPLRTGSKWRENLENCMHGETQMTVTQITGASPTEQKHPWQQLAWPKIKAHVFRLQMRIAKAGKAKSKLCNDSLFDGTVLIGMFVCN